jgi:hypothetical protein
MKTTTGNYPFGSKLSPLVQLDRSPKKVFVLGVYASAVHAKWIGPDGRLLVRALAVASEPVIFWDGSDADKIVGSIAMPKMAGHLEPADSKFNGPSGRSIDDDFLNPLSVARKDTWLCDLVPHTCLNAGQLAAINREYNPRRGAWSLPAVDLPDVPKTFADEDRRAEILSEIEEAKPEVIILLGDQPIRHFLVHHHAQWKKLADFPTYGRLHPVTIGISNYLVLPLAHPRQVSGLGMHSGMWRRRHDAWKTEVAPKLL